VYEKLIALIMFALPILGLIRIVWPHFGERKATAIKMHGLVTVGLGQSNEFNAEIYRYSTSSCHDTVTDSVLGDKFISLFILSFFHFHI